SEPEVARPREPLEIRIDDEAHDRDRPEPAHDRIQLPDRGEEERKREEAEDDDLGDGQLAARQLPPRRARVPCVDPPVDPAAERHSERAGADHRDRDPEEVVAAWRPADREERADVGERQREDRVLDLDETCEPRGERCDYGAHVCLWWTSVSPARSSSA